MQSLRSVTKDSSARASLLDGVTSCEERMSPGSSHLVPAMGSVAQKDDSSIIPAAGSAPQAVSVQDSEGVTTRETESRSSDASCSKKIRFDSSSSQTKSDTSSNKPRLTLSAFRRPEHTVRLTDSDPSRRLEQEYDLHTAGGVLGRGAFSTVRLAIRRRDGLKVAIKSIAKHTALRFRRLRPRGRRHLEEWQILQQMQNHAYVIGLLDVFETDEEIQLVTEYCRGGELFNAIQKKRSRCNMRRGQYSEEQAASITRQILHALNDLHAADIVHRDVKPENIFLLTEHKNDDDNDIRVKLGDFGMARALHRETTAADVIASDGESSPSTPGKSRAYTNLGSADYYVAPEVYCGDDYGTASDIYSLGVTVYILLCGFPPVFAGAEKSQVIFPHTYWKDISSEAKELVEKMLNPDPSCRLSAKDALEDRWLSSGGPVATASGRKPTPSVQDVNAGRPVLNLDLVRQRLYQLGAMNNKTAESRKRSSIFRPRQGPATAAPSRKRPRMERRASGALMALADLYRGVASTSAEDFAASFDEMNDDDPPSVVDETCDDDGKGGFALKPALSV